MKTCAVSSPIPSMAVQKNLVAHGGPGTMLSRSTICGLPFKLWLVIRLSLIEDDASTRDALVALFKGTPGFQLVSAHANAEDALAHLPRSKVDVVLVDIGLPGVSGIE